MAMCLPLSPHLRAEECYSKSIHLTAEENKKYVKFSPSPTAELLATTWPQIGDLG